MAKKYEIAKKAMKAIKYNEIYSMKKAKKKASESYD